MIKAVFGLAAVCAMFSHVLADGARRSVPQTGAAPAAASQAGMPTVPQTTGSAVRTAQAQAALDFHNAKRAEVGTPPLQWSAQLAAVAQTWANHLAKDANCSLQHTRSNTYGENLFGGSGMAYTAVDAANSWYSEKPKYGGGELTNDNWAASGHYTQMVWRNTTQVGMGQATCNGAIVIVAEYDPAGNYMGEKAY